MKMTIAEIAAATEARFLCDPASADACATSVTWDSRTVRQGALYVALPGERVDGHGFVAQALLAGAVAALVSREVADEAREVAQRTGAALLLVDDCQCALAHLASDWRGRLEGVVVGLTGSSGKTTTKMLVREVLASRMRVTATDANQNNEIGVPNTVLSATGDEQVVVVEMGMRGLGQIAELCEIARPDWGLVTNAGESHIELLGSRDNIARAKAELFEALPDYGVAFVNAADEAAGALREYGRLDSRGMTVVCFDGSGSDRPAPLGEPGCESLPYVWASDVDLGALGAPSFTLNANNVPVVSAEAGTAMDPLWTTTGSVRCKLRLAGLHNVSNACAATAVGLVAGMRLEECADALAQVQPERGRQYVVRASSGLTVVDDAYNANPDSMGASLRAFAAMEVEGCRIAVLGDMLELGSFARDGHERMGALAAHLGIDELVCVGELSRFMAEAAVRAGMDARAVRTCDDAAAALDVARSLACADDAVLVKASHSIGLQAVVEGLVV